MLCQRMISQILFFTPPCCMIFKTLIQYLSAYIGSTMGSSPIDMQLLGISDTLPWICTWLHPKWRLHGSNDGKFASELLVDHQSKDAHHGGASVVELHAALEELGLLVEGIPAKVEGTIAEVTDEFVSGSFDVLHDAKLKGTDEGDELEEAGLGDGVRAIDGGPAIGEGIEGVAGVVNVTGKVDSTPGDDLPKEGKHADAAVLDLDVSEAVEPLLIGIVEEAERIEEAERRLDAELALESLKGGGGL